MNIGIKCKACGKAIDYNYDPELCTECLAVVLDYNKDLLFFDDGEDTMSLEEVLKLGCDNEEVS